MNQIDFSRMDLNLVKVLIAIHEEQNVTRAAERLRMSQSGVSHALRNLRTIFNDPLFVRTPGGMIATDLANRIATRLRPIVEDMKDALSLQNEFAPEAADVSIGIGLFAVHPPWLIPELCRAVNERAPGVRLEFRPVTPDTMADAMDARGVSLVIGTPEQVVDKKRFTYTELFEDYLTLAIGANNPYVADTIDLETYARLRHLVVASPHFTRSWIDDVLEKNALSRVISVIVPNQFYISDTLHATSLVCVIMRNLVSADSRIRLIAPPFASEVHRYGQFTHMRDNDNPLILWLRDLVREICATHAVPRTAQPA